MSVTSPRRIVPISLIVRNRVVVVVGDGPDAEARARRFEAAGAAVRRVREGDFSAASLDGAFACLAHCAREATNRSVVKAARGAGCLTYAHDLPAISDFAMPAISRIGPLSFAISTDGRAPTLARRARQELDRLLEPAAAAIEKLVASIGQLRTELPRDRRSRLTAEAQRFHIDGRVHIDTHSATTADPTGGPTGDPTGGPTGDDEPS